MSSTLTLVSHHLCPYVQRAAIALAEKGVVFERIYVDLADKPDWFRALSPLGKVPLLKVGEAVIFESAVILEYLEETQPNPLHPSDAIARADHRSWVEFGSAILNDIWGFYSAPDAPALEAKSQALAEKFGWIEARLVEARIPSDREVARLEAFVMAGLERADDANPDRDPNRDTGGPVDSPRA